MAFQLRQKMLEIAHLDFLFVDFDTGEVIQKYKFEQASLNDSTVDVQQFVSDKLLVDYVSSFKRGCLKRRNISLQINFNIEKVF